jgi:hypothetical protein
MYDSELVHGVGLKLTKTEARKLDLLARQTGRSKNSIMRCLLRLANAGDDETLRLIRQEYRDMNGGLASDR